MQNQLFTSVGSRSWKVNVSMIGIAIGMTIRMIEMRSSTNPARKARISSRAIVAHPDSPADSTRFWVVTKPPAMVNTVAKMFPASRIMRIIAVTSSVFTSASFSTPRLKLR